MCGLFVVLTKKENVLNFKKEVIEATKLIKHRGPDDEKYFFEKNIALGFVRLSIQDLSNL